MQSQPGINHIGLQCTGRCQFIITCVLGILCKKGTVFSGIRMSVCARVRKKELKNHSSQTVVVLVSYVL